MSASHSLRRLHSIREAEERQRRNLMELAVAELRRLENALKNTFKRSRQARALLASGVRSGDPMDRIAALEEMRAAERLAQILTARIDVAQKQAAAIRQEFLAKRIERRQVETLLEAANAQEAIETNRKSQSALDDWHSAKRFRKNRPIRSVTSEI